MQYTQLVSLVEASVESFNSIFKTDIKFIKSDDVVKDTDVIELEVGNGELISVTVFDSEINSNPEYNGRHYELETVLDEIADSILFEYFDELRYDSVKRIYEEYKNNREMIRLSFSDGAMDTYGLQHCVISSDENGIINHAEISSSIDHETLRQVATRLAWSHV